MTMRRSHTTTLLGLGLLGIFGSWAKGADPELKVGDDAPPFTLQGSDGNTHDLKDFRGKSAVVLAWFPKAFTPGCTAQCKSYGRDADALKGLNATYFTVSVDRPETNKKFADSVGATYAILSDPDKAVARAYGVLGPIGVAKRWTFYIDKEGKIRAIDKSIKTGQAAPDTAAKLKELGIAD